jgi:hypothetical protein
MPQSGCNLLCARSKLEEKKYSVRNELYTLYKILVSPSVRHKLVKTFRISFAQFSVENLHQIDGSAIFVIPTVLKIKVT